MRIGLLVSLFFVTLPGETYAQENQPQAEQIADAVSCSLGLAKTKTLLHRKHHVDAHLVAQTMSLLCPETRAHWNIVNAIALANLEEYQRAYGLLEPLALAPGPLATRAEVLAAWVLVQGRLGNPTASNRLDSKDEARIKVYARIRKGASPGKAASLLSEDLRIAVTTGYAKIQSSPHKRPWLAGALSVIIPGLGQGYAGSWESAGISFVLNGLFVAATVELIREDLYFASATTGIAGSVFYVGNILNAVDLVNRYNQGSSASARADLSRILVPEAYY